MGGFYINFSNGNSQCKTITNREVYSYTTIKEVKTLISDIEGGDVHSLNLTAKTKELSDNDKTLEYYGIINQRHIIFAIFDVTGGMNRNFDVNDPLIKLSNQIDCISLEKNNKIPVSQMPCGHAISCLNMFNYIQSKANNLKIIDIECPVVQCKRIWDFDTCAAVANLNQQEYLKYSIIFENRRIAQNTCSCPHCKSFVKRPNNLTHFRVKCLKCKGSDFCFACGNVWKGNGMQICGYSDCSTIALNDILQNCPMKIPDYVKVQVPKYRACPNCLTLIGHKDRCKHMECYKCKTFFCFICLGVKSSNGWPCQSHTYECKVAPRQILS